MTEPETYTLRLRMPLKVACLLFFIVHLGIVLNGPDGYHPPNVDVFWPLMYWFLLITLPLSTACLLFLPWTVRIRVTPKGLFQSFYVGAGPLKLWNKSYALEWREVESVKRITARTWGASLEKSIHFIGSPNGKRISIAITSSYSREYKQALAYALRHVRHATIEEGVEMLADV